MKNGTITMNDGRIVGFADFGSPQQPAVLWCHGGPGNRPEPALVTVLPGADDGMIPVANAHHTAALVPGATLRVVEGLGHISILSKAVAVTSELVARVVFAR